MNDQVGLFPQNELQSATSIEEIEASIRETRLRDLKNLTQKVKMGRSLKPSERSALNRLELELLGNQGLPAGGNDRILKTVEEVSGHYGKSERTIYRWIKKGMPVLPGNRYELDAIERWLDKGQGLEPETVPDNSPEPVDSGVSVSGSGTSGDRGDKPEFGKGKDHWDKENKKYQAKKRELEYRKRKGELVEMVDVEKKLVARIEAVKYLFLSQERALPPRLISCKTESEMAAVLKQVNRKLLEDFSRPLVI